MICCDEMCCVMLCGVVLPCLNDNDVSRLFHNELDVLHVLEMQFQQDRQFIQLLGFLIVFLEQLSQGCFASTDGPKITHNASGACDVM